MASKYATNGHVGVLVRGTANRITRAGAESELRRDLEGVDVEILGGGALGVREGRIGNAGGTLCAIPGEGVEVGGLSDGERDAGLEGN